MVTRTPTRHGSPNARRRTRPTAPHRSATGWWLALVLMLLALALAALPARAATAAPATAASGTSTTASATPAKAGDPESQPIPEGSSGPATISGGASGTLLRLGLGLAVVVGLIALIWYVLKRVQRSRYPALDDRSPTGLIDVLATTALGPSRSLHLVRVGEEIVLIGSTDHSVAPIARIGAEDAVSLVGAMPPGAAARAGAATGDPGTDARARAVATATDGTIVERLRALTTRR